MRKLKTIIFGLIAGILNGLFGAGGGIVIIPMLEKIEGLSPQKAHATVILVMISLTLTSIVFYQSYGNVDWRLSLWVSVGGIVGGIIGAKLLRKLPTKWLRRGFGLMMVLSSIRMMMG